MFYLAMILRLRRWMCLINPRTKVSIWYISRSKERRRRSCIPKQAVIVFAYFTSASLILLSYPSRFGMRTVHMIMCDQFLTSGVVMKFNVPLHFQPQFHTSGDQCISSLNTCIAGRVAREYNVRKAIVPNPTSKYSTRVGYVCQ